MVAAVSGFQLYRTSIWRYKMLLFIRSNRTVIFNVIYVFWISVQEMSTIHINTNNSRLYNNSFFIKSSGPFVVFTFKKTVRNWDTCNELLRVHLDLLLKPNFLMKTLYGLHLIVIDYKTCCKEQSVSKNYLQYIFSNIYRLCSYNSTDRKLYI